MLIGLTLVIASKVPSVADNSNVVLGNAKIEGLEADLNMKGTDYNLIAAIFFIPYLIFGKYPRDSKTASC